MSYTLDVSLNTPVSQNITYNFVSYTIYNVTIELFKSCTIYIVFKGEVETQISKKCLIMSTNQYLSWNNDDSFIVDLVNTNITNLLNCEYSFIAE
jgi:hypothetical protein